MIDAVRLVSAAALAWAMAAMASQTWTAIKSPQRDYSARSGSAWRGIAYSFSGAMLPWRKETISLHWGEFIAGIILHIGVFWGLIAFTALTASPDVGLLIIRPGALVFLLSGIAALILALRRLRSPLLRSFSTPDDYIAITGTALFLLLAGATGVHPTFMVSFMTSGILLLLYMPLGKLRHALFFFLARGNYGRKLGHRGVYPPPSARVRPATQREG